MELLIARPFFLSKTYFLGTQPNVNRINSNYYIKPRENPIPRMMSHTKTVKIANEYALCLNSECKKKAVTFAEGNFISRLRNLFVFSYFMSMLCGQCFTLKRFYCYHNNLHNLSNNRKVVTSFTNLKYLLPRYTFRLHLLPSVHL